MSEWERKVAVGWFWCQTGWSEYFTICSYWDFHAQPFLGFTKNGVKREKHPVPVCSSPVSKNALLMLEVRGEWAD